MAKKLLCALAAVLVFSACASLSSAKLTPPESLANSASLKRGMTDAEFKKAYDIAAKIAAPYAGKSREAQLEGIAKSLYKYKSDKKMKYSETDPHYNDVYGFYVLNVASCAGATRAVGLCLNILGIPYTHVNENEWSHQWCRVKIGKTDWICDVYQARYGPESKPLWAVTVFSNSDSRVEWMEVTRRY